MKRLRQTYTPVFILLTVLMLNACATQLAPAYDKALFDGITQTNIKIMALFASVSKGTKANDFSQREKMYNDIIGNVDALALQSKARPVPQNKVTEKVNQYLQSRGVGALSDGVAPSANALEVVSKNLVKMRDTDQARGLGKDLVPVFKNAVIISMDQALTYEAFLER